jgi:hypothetical protein
MVYMTDPPGNASSRVIRRALVHIAISTRARFFKLRQKFFAIFPGGSAEVSQAIRDIGKEGILGIDERQSQSANPRDYTRSTQDFDANVYITLLLYLEKTHCCLRLVRKPEVDQFSRIVSPA